MPIVVRTIGVRLGRRRNNAHPAFRKSGIGLFRYLFVLEESNAFYRIAGLVLASGILLLALLLLALETSLLLAGAFAVVFIVVYSRWQWTRVLHPLLSARAYRRQLAKARLLRIVRRVEGTREIFGKKVTYTRPRPSSTSRSSSSTRSSSRSSSGGGRSGGGGASSRW